MDLYRLARHRAGHLRDLRRGRPPALRRRPFRPLDTHRRPRRHGWRAAARRHHGRRLLPCGRVPAEPHRDAPAHGLSRPARRHARRGAGDHRAILPRQEAASRSACSATPPRSSRRSSAAASGPTRSPTRPRRTIRSTATCRRAGRSAEWERSARAIPKAVEQAAKQSMAEHVRAMLDFHKAGVPTLDYGNNIRQMAKEEGVDERLRFPRLRAGLYPPALLPRHRPVPLGRALGRSGGHLQDRRQGEGAVARQQAPAQLARHGAGAHPVPGPAGAHLLGGPRRSPSPRPRLQRDGGQAAS